MRKNNQTIVKAMMLREAEHNVKNKLPYPFLIPKIHTLFQINNEKQHSELLPHHHTPQRWHVMR